MSEELLVSSRPELERPILIAAFRGWNDGGQGASLATGYLAKLWNARRFAEIEPENFFDFQATRPHVSLEEGVTRRIDWPSTVFYHGRPPDLDRDVVLLLGIEPNLRWRTFSELIVGFLQDLQIELVISLGSLLADVPHTRPCPVTGSASDPELVERLDLSASRYEGPTGIVGVLHDACRQADLPSASLWAAVPHYVSLTPSPKAALALCERLADVIGAPIDTTELAEAAENYSEQVWRRSRPIRTPRPTSKSSSSERTRSPKRPSCLRETRSRPSSPSSCATASARTATTSPATSSSRLAEREGVRLDARAEAQLEQPALIRRQARERVQPAAANGNDVDRRPVDHAPRPSRARRGRGARSGPGTGAAAGRLGRPRSARPSTFQRPP